jgi:hypothetical protein
MDALLEIVKEYGIYAGVAIYLIYQTRKDYKFVCGRLNEVEDFCRDRLMQTVTHTGEVVERATEAIERNTKVLEDHQEIMKTCEWQKGNS